MKKKILFITTLILFLVVLGFNIKNTINKKNLYETEVIEKNNNKLSLFLEENVGQGDYVLTSRSKWPGNEYLYNEELSGCDNGSTLKWDDTKKAITVSGGVLDKCHIYFDKYDMPVINDVEIVTTPTSIKIIVDASPGFSDLDYYNFYVVDWNDEDIGTLEYSNEKEFLVDDLDDAAYYYIYLEVTDKMGRTVEYESDEIELFYNLADYIISLYNGTQGRNNIYYHDSTLLNGAGDNSYRYSGSSVNNYICLGSSESPCPADNLYRIIGVFDGRVKVVKNTTIDGAWNTMGNNIWASSSINKYLNSTYLNSSLSAISDKIANTTWVVGGNTSVNILNLNAAGAYQNEIINPAEKTTYGPAKIGLLYVTDYGFAAANPYWTTLLRNYNQLRSYNWLFDNILMPFITRKSDTTNLVYSTFSGQVTVAGMVSTIAVTNSENVKPAFYLKPSVLYSSGDGSSSSPFYIKD